MYSLKYRWLITYYLNKIAIRIIAKSFIAILFQFKRFYCFKLRIVVLVIYHLSSIIYLEYSQFRLVPFLILMFWVQFELNVNVFCWNSISWSASLWCCCDLGITEDSSSIGSLDAIRPFDLNVRTVHIDDRRRWWSLRRLFCGGFLWFFCDWLRSQCAFRGGNGNQSRLVQVHSMRVGHLISMNGLGPHWWCSLIWFNKWWTWANINSVEDDFEIA